MPKISIITPVHINIPEKIDWLDEAIQSVISQTLSDWEMIIIDDKSPFNEDSLELKYINDPRIRWLKNSENFGPAMTRNTAVALAESEAILPLDADDMLAGDDVLSKLYDAWIEDQTKIIFGDLTVWEPGGINGQFRAGTTHRLTQYTFEKAMNLGGIMPVTALHSKECHYRAGGWKKELDAGLEDVEYWLAAGKAGFCGHKVNEVVLLYRRQEKSRAYELRHINQREHEMRLWIENFHADVYRGEYPMGCCGGKSSGNNSGSGTAMMASAQGQKITTLNDYAEKDKIWIQYVGPRAAKWSILSRGGRPSYIILGTGHYFEARVEDADFFRGQERGSGFLVGVPAPSSEQEITPETSSNSTNVFSPEQPSLSTIERLDSKAIENSTPSVVLEQQGVPPVNLGMLQLGRIEDELKADGWTVEKISLANASELIKYRGVGETRANIIISKAKSILQG